MNAVLGATDAPRRPPAPARVLPDVTLLAVSLAAGLGVARLTAQPTAWRVLGPVVATVAAGHLTTSLVRRLRAPAPVAGACGVAAVCLSTLWGQFLSATRGGVPTAAAWRAVGSRFAAGYHVIRSHPTPVPATAGVVLWVAAGAGLVAVLARTLWAWPDRRSARPLLALAPSFGLFSYTALLSSQIDRVPGALSYLVSALAFLVAAQTVTTGPSGALAAQVAAAPARRTGARRLRAVLPGAWAALLAVAVPLAVSPVLGALKVNALPFPSDRKAGSLSIAPGGPGAGGGPRSGLGAQAPFGVQAINLVDDLQAVIESRSDEPMFSATTPRPSYWQVAVLTLFTGTAWLPDPHTQTAVQSIQVPLAGGSAAFLPVLPQPRPVKTFRARITIEDLESTLLPLPSTVVGVDSDATFLAGFGAVRSYETASGYSYTAEAAVPGGAPSAAAGTSVAAALENGQVTPGELEPYLQIPPMPGPVVNLAHQIVAGAGSPAAEAGALARWFNSGRFRYTLTPPPSPGDPLSSFLFTTRAGFCQQFAAAYAALARIDGLPTRIAVGFTTGTPAGTDHYRVTGADAHVWPEVYLGPTAGWVSFEPTPATTGEPTGVGVDSGAHVTSPGAGAQSSASTASTVTSQRHASSATTVPSTTPGAPHGAPARRQGTTSASGDGGWIVASLLVLLVAGAVTFMLVRTGRMGAVLRWWRRRWRRRHHPATGRATRPAWLARVPGLARLGWLARARWLSPTTSDPTALVLDHYDGASAALERARLGRRPAETIDEHVRRLRALAGAKWLVPYAPAIPEAGTAQAHAAEDAIEAYSRLATLAARASYGPAHCTPAEAADAERLGLAVESGLDAVAAPGRRARGAREPAGV
ncbi:MAG TPA: transglutaminaseTgpA domain-containing protein [Acidimicrobiales bacterium]|nr:transglutaminaseTgpA domain-containing protein [Acidimicrobiales bacterium]